jgi:hypothetical protein
LWRAFSRYLLKNYLTRLTSNFDPPDLCFWVARITGVSHQHLAILSILNLW